MSKLLQTGDVFTNNNYSGLWMILETKDHYGHVCFIGSDGVRYEKSVQHKVTIPHYESTEQIKLFNVADLFLDYKKDIFSL